MPSSNSFELNVAGNIFLLQATFHGKKHVHITLLVIIFIDLNTYKTNITILSQQQERTVSVEIKSDSDSTVFSGDRISKTESENTQQSSCLLCGSSAITMYVYLFTKVIKNIQRLPQISQFQMNPLPNQILQIFLTENSGSGLDPH